MAGPVSVAELTEDPHPLLHRLRTEHPVAWVDSLDAWLITSHHLSVEVMLDPDTFTVDDPRFSTQRVIGPSMLSLDGLDHRRHRDPFAGPFRAARIRDLRDRIRDRADELISKVVSVGDGDLRAGVAAPLAVDVMADILDLENVAVGDVLDWYREIVDAVHAVTAGEEVPSSGISAFRQLSEAVRASLSSSSLLTSVDRAGDLSAEEIVSNVAVLLFGGIVTSESSTAVAYRYLLENPEHHNLLRQDRALVGPFVEETFRLEPTAAAVDRYATRDVTLAGSDISVGDLVRVSISGANRDPAVFSDPDTLRLHRDHSGKSLTFARGPHACLGIHLARLETVSAVEALLDHPLPAVSGALAPVTGLVFRVPDTLRVVWRETGDAPN
ncbi:MAG TPA: cytochrome P450 [Acidimicrobiia bacterium]|nr:cytochrome P450 [Acidimicrobiia bacterium]